MALNRFRQRGPGQRSLRLLRAVRQVASLNHAAAPLGSARDAIASGTTSSGETRY